MTPLAQHVQICTLCPHFTLHSFLVPHLWLKVNLIVCPKYSFHVVSLARCLLLLTEHAALHPLLFPLFQVSKGCSHPEIFALIHENAKETDFLIQNLSQGMSPTGSSTTGSLLNRRILPALKTIRLPKLRVMSELCPTTSYCCHPLKILLKNIATPQEADSDDEQICALLASPGAYQSETQVRNDRKFMTLKEKA